MTEISQEAVEQLAKERVDQAFMSAWEDCTDRQKAAWCDDALADLEECLPAIQAQVLAGVKERLLNDRQAIDAAALVIAKQQSRKYYAPQSLEEAYPDEKERAIAWGNAKLVLRSVLATLNPPVPASEVVGILKGHRSVYDQEGKG